MLPWMGCPFTPVNVVVSLTTVVGPGDGPTPSSVESMVSRLSFICRLGSSTPQCDPSAIELLASP